MAKMSEVYIKPFLRSFKAFGQTYEVSERAFYHTALHARSQWMLFYLTLSFANIKVMGM